MESSDCNLKGAELLMKENSLKTHIDADLELMKNEVKLMLKEKHE